MFDEDGNERPNKTEKLIQNYIKGERNAEMHLKYNLWTPWSRMVKKSIVTSHNLKFDELPAGNDKMFCLYCSRYSTRMTAALDVTYRYYRSSKGSQTDKNRANMFDGLIDVRCRTIKLFLEVGYEPKPSLLKLILNSKYNKGISKLKLFKLYWKSLNRANYSFFPDFCSFLTNRE
jgi:hypothetical protein